jgi:hypothetical protein
VVQVHEFGADDDQLGGQGAQAVLAAGDGPADAVAEEPGVVLVWVEQDGGWNVGRYGLILRAAVSRDAKGKRTRYKFDGRLVRPVRTETSSLAKNGCRLYAHPVG